MSNKKAQENDGESYEYEEILPKNLVKKNFFSNEMRIFH
jgi:hypothetical protein